MSKSTILLTGATGFLGSHLLDALLSQGYKVVILKRSTSDLWRIAHLLDQVKSYDVDTQALEQAFEEQHIDCVIHTACHYGRNGDPASQIVESNLMFGLRILDACLKFKIKTFINTDTFFNNKSSTQKYLGAYTLSKKQFLDWLDQSSKNVQIINLKLHHIYGPKDDITKFVPWVVSQLRQNVPEIKLTKGEQQRDFIYISDVVSAYLKVLEKAPILARINEFDVGTGQLVTVKEFLNQLKQVYKNNIVMINTKLNFGAFPYREDEMMTVVLNNKSLIDLGWQPETDLYAGLKKTLNDDYGTLKLEKEQGTCHKGEWGK